MKNWVLSNYGYHGFPKVGGCPFSKVLVSFGDLAMESIGKVAPPTSTLAQPS